MTGSEPEKATGKEVPDVVPPDVDDAEDADLEKAEAEEAEGGDTFDEEGTGAGLPPKTMTKRQKSQEEIGGVGLSVISQKYDLDGDGTLDEVEQTMRNYDKNNDGELSMQEIKKIVEDLHRQQRELDNERKTILNMKKVIIFLCVFTLVLALAMLGVSFAAATLAKDTRVDSSTTAPAFTDKRTNEALSTIGGARTGAFELEANETDDQPGRRLLGSTSSFVGREMRRRINEQHVEKHGRELFACMKASCGGRRPGGRGSRGSGGTNNNNNNNNGLVYSNNNNNDDRFIPRNDNLNIGYNDWDDCKVFEGEMDFVEFDRIRTAVRRGESSFMLYWEYRQSSLSKRVQVDMQYIDGVENFMVVESNNEKDCGGYINSNTGVGCSNCQTYNAVYIFENCRARGGVNRNYNNGRYNNNYDGIDNYYCQNCVCDLLTCKLGIDNFGRY